VADAVSEATKREAAGAGAAYLARAALMADWTFKTSTWVRISAIYFFSPDRRFKFHRGLILQPGFTN
jgi:hypothetical protein